MLIVVINFKINIKYKLTLNVVKYSF